MGNFQGEFIVQLLSHVHSYDSFVSVNTNLGNKFLTVSLYHDVKTKVLSPMFVRGTLPSLSFGAGVMGTGREQTVCISACYLPCSFNCPNPIVDVTPMSNLPLS